MTDEKPKLFSTFELREETKNFLTDKFRYEYWNRDREMTMEEFKSNITDVDVLLCSAVNDINSEIVDSGKELKVISTRTAGYDHIDVDKANKRGIKVAKVSGPIAEGVAETTVGLMLSLGRGIHEANNFINNSEWDNVKEVWRNKWKVTILKGKKVGIVGMGAIGSRIVELLDTLGMDIYYFNRSRKKDIEDRHNVEYMELVTLASEVDYLVSALPLSEETRYTFDENIFEKMKETSTFINISRGEVVNTNDLIKALQRDSIKNAAIDVYEEEPLPKDSELFDVDEDKLLMTPHMAGLSIETGKKAGLESAKNAYDALKGKDNPNIIN